MSDLWKLGTDLYDVMLRIVVEDKLEKRYWDRVEEIAAAEEYINNLTNVEYTLLLEETYARMGM